MHELAPIRKYPLLWNISLLWHSIIIFWASSYVVQHPMYNIQYWASSCFIYYCCIMYCSRFCIIEYWSRDTQGNVKSLILNSIIYRVIPYPILSYEKKTIHCYTISNVSHNVFNCILCYAISYIAQYHMVSTFHKISYFVQHRVLSSMICSKIGYTMA